jgi:hypothetical protein
MMEGDIRAVVGNSRRGRSAYPFTETVDAPIYKDLPQSSSTGNSSTRSSAVETKGSRMTNRQKEPDRTNQIEKTPTDDCAIRNTSDTSSSPPDIPYPASSPSFHQRTVRCSSRRTYHSQYISWHRGQLIPVPSIYSDFNADWLKFCCVIVSLQDSEWHSAGPCFEFGLPWFHAPASCTST